MKHRPIAIGLVVCEQVIVDEKSRNVTPVNCFRSRRVKTLPAEIPFTVVAWLTNGMGHAKIEVVVERLDNMDEVARFRSDFEFSDPLQELRCVVQISDCIFPVAGQYQVSLLADSELMAHRKMVVQA